MEKLYDVIILGAGPAGMTAAVYATRAGLSTLVLEKAYAGGQMTTTAEIENYPGLRLISGFELSVQMAEQAKSLGAEIKTAEVLSLSFSESGHTVETSDGPLHSRTIIAALGAARRKLSVDGEERLAGSGVSYCATCDGGFFKGRDVCVVGGGNTALEDALYLSKLCRRVYLIHRRDTFRGFQSFVDSVTNADNIECVYNSTVTSINGGVAVESVSVKNVKDGNVRDIPASACFIAVGSLPNTSLLRDKVALTDSGYVRAVEDTATSVAGVFAAGDLREKPIYQIVTACADGAVAAHMAGVYISEKR